MKKETLIDMKQDKYWDSIASNKVFSTEFLFDNFKAFCNSSNRILDYGCGYGRVLKELHEKGYTNIVGVDFSSEMINRAKKEDSSIEYHVINSGTTPFENESVDCVILLAVLSTVYKNEEQDKIIDEVKRILKPNGKIYINDFLVNTDERNEKRYEKFYPKYKDYGVFELEGGAIIKHFREERKKELLRGFEEAFYKEVLHPTMNNHVSRGFTYIGIKKD